MGMRWGDGRMLVPTVAMSRRRREEEQEGRRDLGKNYRSEGEDVYGIEFEGQEHMVHTVGEEDKQEGGKSQVECTASRDQEEQRSASVAVRYDAGTGGIVFRGGALSAFLSVWQISIDQSAVLRSLMCATV